MVIFYIHILLRSVRTCGTMNLSFTTSLSRHPKPELLCLVWTDNQVTPCCHCVLRSWAFTALGFFLEKSRSICSGTVGVNSLLKKKRFSFAAWMGANTLASTWVCKERSELWKFIFSWEFARRVQDMQIRLYLPLDI